MYFKNYHLAVGEFLDRQENGNKFACVVASGRGWIVMDVKKPLPRGQQVIVCHEDLPLSSRDLAAIDGAIRAHERNIEKRAATREG